MLVVLPALVSWGLTRGALDWWLRPWRRARAASGNPPPRWIWRALVRSFAVLAGGMAGLLAALYWGCDSAVSILVDGGLVPISPPIGFLLGLAGGTQATAIVGLIRRKTKDLTNSAGSDG